MMEVMFKRRKWNFYFFLSYLGLLKTIEFILHCMLLVSFSLNQDEKNYDLHFIISRVLSIIIMLLNLVSIYIGLAYYASVSFFAFYETGIFVIVLLGNLLNYLASIFEKGEGDQNTLSIQSYFFDHTEDRGYFSRTHLLVHFICLLCCIIKKTFTTKLPRKSMFDKSNFKTVKQIKDIQQVKQVKRLDKRMNKLMEMLVKFMSKLEKDEVDEVVSKELETEDEKLKKRKKIKVSPDLYILPSNHSLSFDSSHKPLSTRLDSMLVNNNDDVNKNRIKYLDTSVSENSDICDISDIGSNKKNIHGTNTPGSSFNDDLLECNSSEGHADFEDSLEIIWKKHLKNELGKQNSLVDVNINEKSLMEDLCELKFASDDSKYRCNNNDDEPTECKFAIEHLQKQNENTMSKNLADLRKFLTSDFLASKSSNSGEVSKSIDTKLNEYLDELDMSKKLYEELSSLEHCSLEASQMLAYKEKKIVKDNGINKYLDTAAKSIRYMNFPTNNTKLSPE